MSDDWNSVRSTTAATLPFTLTPHSSILIVARVTAQSRIMQATDEGSLIAMAANLIQVDCTNASSKVSTAEGHCIYWRNRCEVTACNNTYILLKVFFWLWVEYPSCRHTTVASALPQKSSHTVPHSLSMQISTLPSFAMLPPTSRSWPCVQGAVRQSGKPHKPQSFIK